MRSLGGRCHCCQSLARAARIRLRHDSSRSFSTTSILAVNGAPEPIKLPSRNWGELKSIRPPPPRAPQRTWNDSREASTPAPGPARGFGAPLPRRSWGELQTETPNPPTPSGPPNSFGTPRQGWNNRADQFQPRNQFAQPTPRSPPSGFGLGGPSTSGPSRQVSAGFQDRLNTVHPKARFPPLQMAPSRAGLRGRPQFGQGKDEDLGPPEASGFGLFKGGQKAVPRPTGPLSKFGSPTRPNGPPSKFGPMGAREGSIQPDLKLKRNARRAAVDEGMEVDERELDDGALEMGDDGELVRSKKKHGAKASMSFKDRMAMMAQGGEEFEITRGRGAKSERSQAPMMTMEDREREERKRLKQEAKRAKQLQAERQVFIPSSVTVARLAGILGLKWSRLQIRMAQLGMTEEQRRSDYMLTEEEAVNVALEFGFDPRIDDEAFFDIVPHADPPGVVQPLRPPIVTIMGHVDHGKTTLLDSLRNTAVAAGEAGGITQHIGAFSVALSSLQGATVSPEQDSMITFLDTPGHAAFTEMRARGATVTDIVVLVVAADDGVMPQTKEVLNLVKEAGDDVGLVVAINKVDKHGVDIERIKSSLGAEGIHLEEDGGDVPSVRVSGLTKLGLDNLVETLSTLAELRELRARADGQAEGYVLESNKDQGKGSVATVLVTKGTLHTGSYIVAGTTFCRVRSMMNDQGAILETAGPGTPVQVTGWRDLPEAGDQLLESVNGEQEARKAIANRIAAQEQQKMLADTEVINTKRQEDRLKHELETEEEKAIRKAGGNVTLHRIEQARRAAELAKENAIKELRLIIKGDVSGTVEAVEGALSGIGNKEAVVKIVSTGVGAISESDLTMAEATDGLVIGFNVDCSKPLQQLARQLGVSIHLESVIYRLIDTVRQKTAALLPPSIEYRTLGEASVQQIFEISLKKKQKAYIAGCKVNQGTIKRGGLVRVFRGENRVLVFEGTIETLKHIKKDVEEMRKGTECGMGLADFKDVKEGDEIVAVDKVEVPRTL